MSEVAQCEHGTVVVTGGAGYIGSHVVFALREAGWRVAVIDDLSTGRREVVPDDVRLHEIDCASDAVGAILRAENAVAAIHFAARIRVDESIAEPALYYETNTVSAKRFFESALSAGVKAIVFSSTAAVYGDVPSTPVSEDAPTRPLTPYGRSKLASEWILHDLCAAARPPVGHAILRYFNVAGADPRGRSGPPDTATHLVKRVCDAALGRDDRMVINGDDYPTPDGTCVRDFIHVCDLAEAHVLALAHLLGGGEDLLLNCGYGRGFSVREVIEAARRISGQPIPETVGPRRPGDLVSVVADPSRLKSRLGWQPAHPDIDEIVGSTLHWAAAPALVGLAR
jgi:UDP-glucose 4-epimerase